MKNNRIWIGILLLAFVVGVAGQPLADANDTGGAKDRLVGILLAQEPPDRLDFSDARIQAGQTGDDVILSEVSRQKIYATESRNEQGKTYTFPGIDDPHVIFVREENPDGFASVYLDQTPGIVTFLDYNDKGDTGDVELQAEVHVSAEEETILYPCLLYREGNGKVYTAGSEPSWLLHEESLGHLLTLTFEESFTRNRNGIEEDDSIRIELALYVDLPPDAFRLIEMDEDHGIVQEMQYDNKKLPESYAPKADCAYLLLETLRTDRDGKPFTERRIFARGDESLDVYICESTFCERQTVVLHW